MDGAPAPAHLLRSQPASLPVNHALSARPSRPFSGARRLAAVIGLLLPATGSADVVVMTTGSRIACTRAAEVAGRIRIELANGGVVHVAPDTVKRIEAGAGDGRGSRGQVLSASSGGHGSAEAGSRDGSAPALARARRASLPVDAEVAYGGAPSDDRTADMPPETGLIDGVEPVPSPAELRAGDGKPLDPKRQAWANRSRLSPGSAGALMSRPHAGAGARGGWRGDSASEPPRVGR